MSKYRYIIIIFLVCAAMSMTAQQVYPDTFKLQDQNMAADLDMYLLDLVGKQSAELHAGDTTADITDTLSMEELLRLDSIQREMAEVDSLRTVNAVLTLQKMQGTPEIVIEKSWFRDEVEDRNDVLRVIRDMKTRWRKEATLMAQITQNYVTANWYQGGSSSFAALGIAKGQIGYFGERFTWENTGEWRMGGSTISADSLHKVNTTDDLFRLYSKANFRIVPKLYTSVSMEFETRLLPTYKSNSMNLKSAPFAPLRFNAAFGLDYKPVKNLSVSFSPLSYKLVYISDTVRVNGKDFGLKEGEQIQHNVGSSVRVEYVWKPVREFALETKFFFYTNYHGIEADLEVNLDFIINRYLTTRLMLHPRYDSSVIMEGDKHAKIQFRELLSIGFAHKFR